jgi:carotenoid 1,2-hydratase
VSDDGRYGLTVIAFVGSVFSPFYASARRRGPADPLDYCAFNVVLHDGHRQRWALTEWPRQTVRRAPDLLEIGPNRLCWNAEQLEVRFDERLVPFGQRLTGRLSLRGEPHPLQTFHLDAAGLHRWSPIAPRARIEVELERPQIRFTGSGYLDHNRGEAPLEQDFCGWTWSRAALSDGTAVLYDVERRDGTSLSLGLCFHRDGTTREVPGLETANLPAGRWGISRHTRVDRETHACVERTIADTPFYIRSLLRTHLLGEEATAMHEALSLERFTRPWVQRLLPFRIRRQERLPR